MLILNTPDGDFAIAKGNIHTIQEDYDVGYYYVTKDIASYPFRSIIGVDNCLYIVIKISLILQLPLDK